MDVCLSSLRIMMLTLSILLKDSSCIYNFSLMLLLLILLLWRCSTRYDCWSNRLDHVRYYLVWGSWNLKIRSITLLCLISWLLLLQSRHYPILIISRVFNFQVLLLLLLLFIWQIRISTIFSWLRMIPALKCRIVW